LGEWMHTTTTVVDLPAGDLVDCHDFARAIAEFRYPVPQEGATGMACMTGSKMVDYSYRARPNVFASGSPREQQQTALDFPAERFDPTPSAIPCPPLNSNTQLSLPILGMPSELSFPVKLTAKNKEFLEAMLNELPELRYPITEWAQVHFLAMFRERVDALQLVGEEIWEPILVTGHYAERQRQYQERFVAENGMVAIGEELERGLDVVDRNGHPVATLDANLGPGHYFLSRQLAIDVLARLGFPYEVAAEDAAAEDAAAGDVMIAGAVDATPPREAVQDPTFVPCVPNKAIAITKLALKAAWKIELERKRHARPDEVIAMLQSWVEAEDDDDYILEQSKERDRVSWVTAKGVQKPYGLEACSKTLKEWHERRRQEDCGGIPMAVSSGACT
jgi:hypothetical protein